MSDIWQSGNPLTQPPRWAVTLAGLVLVVIAGGSLVMGLMAGWQRGEPRSDGGAPTQANSSAVDAVPLSGPEVTLRDANTPTQPAVAEPAKVETPEETTPTQRAANSAPTEDQPSVQTPPPADTAAHAPPEPPAAEPAAPPAAEAPPAQTPSPSTATPF